MVGENVVFFVSSRLVAKRRRKRMAHVPLDLVIFGVAISLALGATSFPSQLGVSNPSGLFFASLALFAVGTYALWIDLRFLHQINPVSIAEIGLYPPFKPRQRLSRHDWFVRYRDITSMVPVAEKGGFVPAYDVTLRDGLTFQLNALDLLVYVNEREVRRFAKMLEIIRAELERPENQGRAKRGDDVVIPKDLFDAATRLSA